MRWQQSQNVASRAVTDGAKAEPGLLLWIFVLNFLGFDPRHHFTQFFSNNFQFAIIILLVKIVEVLQAGKYDMDELAGWSQGDWNRDMRFDRLDIVGAFDRAL